DVTSDVSALDSAGSWIVVVVFEGEAVCARFDRVLGAPTGWPAWSGPPAGAWSSSLDRDAFHKGVVDIREAIAAGDVYEVNLCRVLSAPLSSAADIAGLGGVLRVGNPSPYGAVVRLPGVVELASASPELFLRREGDVVESRPIKGTAPSGATRRRHLPGAGTAPAMPTPARRRRGAARRRHRATGCRPAGRRRGRRCRQRSTAAPTAPGTG